MIDAYTWCRKHGKADPCAECKAEHEANNKPRTVRDGIGERAMFQPKSEVHHTPGGAMIIVHHSVKSDEPPVSLHPDYRCEYCGEKHREEDCRNVDPSGPLDGRHDYYDSTVREIVAEVATLNEENTVGDSFALRVVDGRFLALGIHGAIECDEKSLRTIAAYAIREAKRLKAGGA